MKRHILFLPSVALAIVLFSSLPHILFTSPTQAGSICPVASYNFDKEQAGKVPSGFSFSKTGQGSNGRWVVQIDPTAPSGKRVLAQVDADDTDYRFPIALVNQCAARDLRLSVKCKAVSGRVDQAAGLVFRYQDANNYYITRANALEDNVRLYRVVKGERKQIGDWHGHVAPGEWHAYQVQAQGDHIQVFWDGKKVIDTYDQTFLSEGKVGVWTKADSITYFDDLTITLIK